MLLRSSLIALALAAGIAQAQPADVSGVRYPATVQVASQPLLLNGAGTRYKLVVKVYTAGLYLTAPADSAEGVLSSPGPKRLHLVILREIDANELGKLFTKGMQENATREDFAKAIPGIATLGEMFAKRRRLVAGDTVSIDWQPGTGTLISVNGRPEHAQAIREPEFYASLLRIWLGRSPADHLLKDALLGQAKPA